MPSFEKAELSREFYRQQLKEQLYRRSGFDRRSGKDRRQVNVMNYFVRLFKDRRRRKERRRFDDRREGWERMSRWSRLYRYFDF